MSRFIIIHYNEIGLKGKNRSFFETRLLENVKRALFGLEFEKVKRIPGRMLVQLPPPKTLRLKAYRPRLEKVFGVAYFAFAYPASQEISKLKKQIWDITKKKNFKSFKIASKRSQKNYPLTSQEINAQVGEFIRTKSGKKVKLEKPDLTIFVEVVGRGSFFYFEKIPGPGGLPVTTAGKVVSLISGGIDSPVAAWLMMKRGSYNIFLHFHSYPFTNKASQKNVEDLIKILTPWQFQSQVYFVPFSQIQQKIIASTKKDYWLLLYRRAMVRIAQKLAQKEKALALVTGESLGQVASQTLENLAVIGEISKIPIFRPLLGLDKQEIIRLAQKIGTYKTSIRPFKDCCSLFVPEHPQTKASLSKVNLEEKKFPVEKLCQEALKKAEIKKF